jgi:uncharacterized protein (TIGR03086 family)
VTTDNAANVADGVELFERAISYALSSLRLVSYDALLRPSPCVGWDLRDLMAHLDDSLAAITEAVELGVVEPPPQGTPPAAGAWSADGRPESDPVATLRSRTSRVLGAWTNATDLDDISIGGFRLATDLLATTGALEVAVHGWDIAQTCGYPQPIPDALAEELLHRARLVVTEADRPQRFAPECAVSPDAGAAARLLAFVGRRPPPDTQPPRRLT